MAVHHQTQIAIGPVALKVLVADTPALRERGLSGLSSLGSADGMLFVFDQPDSGLWMKDMVFPLDIIWISSDLQVVDITEDAEPESYPHLFHSQEPAQFAVEVPAGFVKQHHISIGDRVAGS